MFFLASLVFWTLLLYYTPFVKIILLYPPLHKCQVYNNHSFIISGSQEQLPDCLCHIPFVQHHTVFVTPSVCCLGQSVTNNPP